MQFPKNFIWVVLILVVALVAYAIGQQGQTVKRINFGGDSGVLVEFDKLKEIPKDDLENRQNELEKKLNKVEEDFRETPKTSKNTQQEFNLSAAIPNSKW